MCYLFIGLLMGLKKLPKKTAEPPYCMYLVEYYSKVKAIVYLCFVLVDFKNNFSLTSLPNVDLYAMFCNLLDLQPSANNGSLSPVCHMLSDPMACTPRDTGTTTAKNIAHSAVMHVELQKVHLLLSLVIFVTVRFS